MFETDNLKVFSWQSALIAISQREEPCRGLLYQYRVVDFETGESRRSHLYQSEREAIVAAKIQALDLAIGKVVHPAGLVDLSNDRVIRTNLASQDLFGRSLEGKLMSSICSDLENVANFYRNLKMNGSCLGVTKLATVLGDRDILTSAVSYPDLGLFRCDVLFLSKGYCESH